MAVNKIAKARARGLRISCATQLLALPVALAFVAVLLVIANTLPPDTSPLVIVAGGVLLVGVVFVFPIAVIGTGVVRYRARRLDRAFAHIGPGRQYSVVGRGWQGEHAGRQLNAWFSKGPQLELYVAGDTGAVAGVGQDNTIVSIATNIGGLSVIALDGGFVAGGRDLDWTERWLAQPGVREAVAVLLEDDERSLRSIAVLPDSVRFVARYLAVGDLTEAAVLRWTEAATTCVVAAEAVGEPEERREPGVGSRLRTYRGGLWVGCVVVLATVGLIAAIAGFVGLVIVLTGG